MGSELASVVFGLASALVWGAGDFCGGLATRRASVFSVLYIGQIAGLALLLAAGIIIQEPLPTGIVILWGAVAGLAGTVGIVALYSGLATGRASVVAPTSAVVAAIMPALFSAVTIGLPDTLKLIGFVVALAAIVLVSQANQGSGETRSLGLAFIAGIGFGAFFIFIHASGSQSTFFPLAIARAASIPFLLIIAILRRTPFPSRTVLPVILLSGILDSGGNVLFLIASELGRLDVATILASLYPASTVILSRIILGEQTTRLQQIGVVAALIAIALIAA
ncbi:MAG TPA: EamA family transporter [Anaerolineae bacterium]|nr:EamA family transporter [Anaerolineae bacterium]